MRLKFAAMETPVHAVNPVPPATLMSTVGVLPLGSAMALVPLLV